MSWPPPPQYLKKARNHAWRSWCFGYTNGKAPKRVFQIAYDERLRFTRKLLLESRGYEVCSQLFACPTMKTSYRLAVTAVPLGTGELGKSSVRDSDSCVGRAPSGHDLLETLSPNVEEYGQ